MNSEDLEIREKKLSKLKKIEKYEKIILYLENWQPGDEIPNYIKHSNGNFKTLEQKEEYVKMLDYSILGLKKETLDEYKMYLSEIVEKESIEFESNNLILAPVGSGKTTFIEGLVKKTSKKSLMLVSNTTLKDSLSPKDESRKIEAKNRRYTTQNKSIHGEGLHETYVMSYAEFGKMVESNDDILNEYSLIICDEIHSLPTYQSYNNSVILAHAIKALFQKREGLQIFYLTATDDNLKKLQKRQPDLMREVTTYEFRNRGDIKKYIALTEFKIQNLDQIRPHLEMRQESFEYFGYKILAFSRTIEEQKKLESLAIEIGFRPLVLWSVNNTNHNMTDEQIEARNHLINYGQIPHPYNFLIINSSMQEGWNLEDKMVKLAILNTTNRTEQIQALGRARKDIDVLIYRVKSPEKADLVYNLPIEYYETKLTTEMKKELCEKLRLKNNRGELMKWTSLKKQLIADGYEVGDDHELIDGKQVRVSVITNGSMQKAYLKTMSLN